MVFGVWCLVFGAWFPERERERTGDSMPKASNHLSGAEFNWVLNCYAVEYPEFASLLTQWRNDTKKQGPRKGLSLKLWYPRGRPLNRLQTKMKTVTNNCRYIKSCRLDGVLFRSAQAEVGLANNNSCFKEQYIEEKTGEPAFAYGVIRSMFEHEFLDTKHVIVFVDYFLEAGLCARTSPMRIRRHKNFDAHPVCLAKNFYLVNLVFWPADPCNQYPQEADLLDVVYYHDLAGQ